ncbi:MAG: 4Fe-4S binding protein [Actinomycetota bacterium]
MATEQRRLDKARKFGFGLGLLKGLGVTFKHLFKHNTVIQYPDEKQDLGPRTRGVIALKEENCTVCMLCARECPDWCIYIDSHKETLPAKREGGRARKRNVLDRFAIDYALCMYCGICVEVCPYDALFWSREFEYAEYDIRELTHEKERLSDWMATVLPPPPLDEGALLPGRPEPQETATTDRPVGAETAAAGATATSTPARGAKVPTAAPSLAPENATEIESDRLPPAPEQGAGTETPTPEQSTGDKTAPSAADTGATATTGTATDAEEHAPPAEKQEQQPAASEEEGAGGTGPGSAQRPAAEAGSGAAQAGETTEKQPDDATDAAAISEQDKSRFQAEPGPNVEVPHEEPHPTALEPTEDADAVYRSVLQEQKDKGSSAQVAEARARVARSKAERGIKRGPTPIDVDKPVPSAPTKGHSEPAPAGAASSETPQPEPGPVAATPPEDASTPDTPTETTDTAPAAETPAAEPEAPAAETAAEEKAAPPSGDDFDSVYERVYAEEKAKGSSDAVATGRAKAARVKAQRAQGD